ncbi:hypothetical protein LguiA_036008 [Lonicera macranthoides]
MPSSSRLSLNLDRTAQELRNGNRYVSGSYACNKKSYNFGDSKTKGIYPSPLVSFHFRRSGTNTSPNSFESRPVPTN